MLLASLLVEDVIADPPKPAGDTTSNIETSAIDRSAAVDKPSPPALVPAAEPKASTTRGGRPFRLR